MINLLKKVSLVFLSIALATLIFYKPPQAKAVFVVDDMVMIGAASALIAAGVTYANSPALRAVTSDFLGTLSTDTQNLFKATVAAGVTSVYLTSTMYQSLKNYINNKLLGYTSSTTLPYSTTQTYSTGVTLGSSSWQVPITTGTLNFVPVMTYNGNGYYNHIYVNDSTGANIIYVLQMYNDVTNYYVNVYTGINGANFQTTLTVPRTINYFSLVVNPTNIKLNNDAGATLYTYTYSNSKFGIIFGDTAGTGHSNTWSNVSYWDGQTVTTTNSNYQYNPTDVPVNTNQYTGNPSFDLSNKTITIPNNPTKPDQLVGVTPQAIPVSDVAATTTNTLLSQIAGAVTSTTGMTDPQSQVNKFKAMVTTKFPFSLPWDMLAVMNMIAATPVRPSVHVDQHLTIAGGQSMPIKFDVDFSFLDSFIGFFRTFEVVAFCYFLISATRRLLGGAQ